jgi:microcystin-dependent protein
MPAQPFIGEIFSSAFNFAPAGYLFCDGSLLPISQFTALFSLLGTTYGGDGRQTFGLPDLRGRVPMMFGQSPGTSPYNLGDRGGVEGVTLDIGQMPAHNHQLNASSANGNSTSPANRLPAKSSQADKIYGTASDGPMNGNAMSMAGGNQPHENRQPFLALNYYIAIQGIFPSR